MSWGEALHLKIGRDEIAGNGGRGRVIFLPGSVGRARQIAERFDDLRVIENPRHLDVHLGTLKRGNHAIDVAAVPTGMGCPSLGIVVSELIAQGARRLLRVGSAGSLQPDVVTPGDLVIATSAVRDEGTSDAFAPRDIPAVAHRDWIEALIHAARARGDADHTFAGIVHTKDSFYGREVPLGPQADRNAAYLSMMQQLGVVATEMEAAHLFMLAAVHGRDVSPVSTPSGSTQAIKAGAVLAVIGDLKGFAPREVGARTELRAIELALDAAALLIRSESAP